MIKLIIFVILMAIYAFFFQDKVHFWFLEVVIATGILFLSYCIEFAISLMKPNKEIEPVLCSHGVPWDECPDCSH
jgi:hypothetical protein